MQKEETQGKKKINQAQSKYEKMEYPPGYWASEALHKIIKFSDPGRTNIEFQN